MIEPPGHTLMDDTIRRQFRCFRVMKHFFQTRCLGHGKWVAPIHCGAGCELCEFRPIWV